MAPRAADEEPLPTLEWSEIWTDKKEIVITFEVPASIKYPDERTLSGSDTDLAIYSDDADTAELVPQQEWITGLPLFMVLGSITLVIFLMLLDMTIIAVVCLHFPLVSLLSITDI